MNDLNSVNVISCHVCMQFGVTLYQDGTRIICGGCLFDKGPKRSDLQNALWYLAKEYRQIHGDDSLPAFIEVLLDD